MPDETPTPEVKPEEPKPTGAICPWCSAEPLRFSYNSTVGSDGMIMQTVWCVACRKTLPGVSAIGRVEMPAPGRIVRPH